MAIERIKKVTIVSPKRADRQLLKTINRLGVMHVTDLGETLPENTVLQYHKASTADADENLRKIDFILNFMNIFCPEQKSFAQGLTPLPVVTTPDELNVILKQYELDEQYRKTNELDEIYRQAERVISEIESELRDLEPLADLPFDIGDFFRPERTCLLFGYLPAKKVPLLDPNIEPWSHLAWENIKSPSPSDLEERTTGKKEERIGMVFAFLPENTEEVRKALSTLEFEEVPLPKIKGKISDRLNELHGDLDTYQRNVAEISRQVYSLAEGHRVGEGRRPLSILKAYWTNSRNRAEALAKTVEGKWLHVVGGYVREKDVARLEAILREEFPDSIITINDPAPDEDVPVSISVTHLFKPIQILVEMFGLPRYRNFDPTPFMQLNFYAFFGICFSDVGYGIMLVLASLYLISKTKDYEGVNLFSRILLYGGISSIIFGAITGSWFGDLYKPEYLGEGNFLLALQERFVLIDPMAKTVVALIFAFAIGVFNQFCGIGLKMYGAIRDRDWMSAFSDGLCWLVALPGFIIIVTKLFVNTPPKLFTAGLWLFALGATGLILTQGRDIKNPIGRILGGVVSLYGIMGSYGIAAFVGDTLSYCRLLALGLTTTIVAMSFNLMAGMLRDIPYVGMFLFILLLLIGHTFNFAISVLGAFVHSMRLIFVEFFGRFYDGGARPFHPLQFDSPMCVMKKSA